MVSFVKGVENVGVIDVQPILVFISSVSVGSDSRLPVLSNLSDNGALLICSCRPFNGIVISLFSVCAFLCASC